MLPFRRLSVRSLRLQGKAEELTERGVGVLITRDAAARIRIFVKKANVLNYLASDEFKSIKDAHRI
jgi:hypothetical protein